MKIAPNSGNIAITSIIASFSNNHTNVSVSTVLTKNTIITSFSNITKYWGLGISWHHVKISQIYLNYTNLAKIWPKQGILWAKLFHEFEEKFH